jgi:hypothetical protein
MSSQTHEWLVSKDAARYLRMSHRTLERWRVNGDGPLFSKAGAGKRARVLYRKSDLDAWLFSRQHSSTSEYGA